MQLREPTLLRELHRQGIDGDPRDPVTNVQAGIHYLRRLLNAFGREEVALMAYNAGPNRILGYLREGAIPERFQVYPRRVQAELLRLHRDIESRTTLSRPPGKGPRGLWWHSGPSRNERGRCGSPKSSSACRVRGPGPACPASSSEPPDAT